MQFIDKQAVLSFFNAPSPTELETWCRENNYHGVEPTRDVPGDKHPSDHVLAAALWYAATSHPDAKNMDICSFGGLVSYLATGWYGGFGTDQYEKERRAENIIIGLAGGAQLAEAGFYAVPTAVVNGVPSVEFTQRVLAFLDAFYFGDEARAVADLMAKNALDLVRAGELMTTSEVAVKYSISDAAVRDRVRKGHLGKDEIVKVSSGWLITRAGAERLWGGKEV
jgi:hypothetical protein